VLLTRRADGALARVLAVASGRAAFPQARRTRSRTLATAKEGPYSPGRLGDRNTRGQVGRLPLARS
jgi:hypothetical protein